MSRLCSSLTALNKLETVPTQKHTFVLKIQNNFGISFFATRKWENFNVNMRTLFVYLLHTAKWNAHTHFDFPNNNGMYFRVALLENPYKYSRFSSAPTRHGKRENISSWLTTWQVGIRRLLPGLSNASYLVIEALILLRSWVALSRPNSVENAFAVTIT